MLLLKDPKATNDPQARHHPALATAMILSVLNRGDRKHFVTHSKHSATRLQQAHLSRHTVDAPYYHGSLA